MISAGKYVEFRNSVYGSIMSHQFSRVEARLADRWGMSSMDLNTAFMGVSVLGNGVVGTRFVQEDKVKFPKTDGLGMAGINNRGLAGLPFDAIDIVLGYQGLPTASLRDYVNSGLYGRTISGFSLGTLDGINAYKYGLATGGQLDAVPLGNVAPSTFKVNLGSMDFVNGGVGGKFFNFGANVCSVGPLGHSLANYSATCQ